MIVSIALTRPHSSAGAALCTLLRRVFVRFQHATDARVSAAGWRARSCRYAFNVRASACTFAPGLYPVTARFPLCGHRHSDFFSDPHRSLFCVHLQLRAPLPTTKKVRTFRGSDFSICNVRIKPCRPNPGRFRTCACRVSSARRVPGPGTCEGRTRRAGLRRSCGWLRSLPDGRPSRC